MFLWMSLDTFGVLLSGIQKKWLCPKKKTEKLNFNYEICIYRFQYEGKCIMIQLVNKYFYLKKSSHVKKPIFVFQILQIKEVYY